MPALAMAFGCNHLMSLACEVDREATEEEMARLDSEVPEERRKCSMLAPAADRARDAAYYAASYVTKAIASSQAANLVLVLAAVTGYLLQGVQPQHANDPAADRRAGFGNLMACANRLTTSITMGLAMISYRLMGLKTYWASYDVKPMPTHAYTGRALRQAGVSDDAVDGGQVEVTLVPQGNGLCGVTALTDYDHRADELEAVPPYIYHMMYGRRQQPKPKQPKARRGAERATKRRRTGAGAAAAAAAYVDAGSASEGSASADEGGADMDGTGGAAPNGKRVARKAVPAPP